MSDLTYALNSEPQHGLRDNRLIGRETKIYYKLGLVKASDTPNQAPNPYDDRVELKEGTAKDFLTDWQRLCKEWLMHGGSEIMGRPDTSGLDFIMAVMFPILNDDGMQTGLWMPYDIQTCITAFQNLYKDTPPVDVMPQGEYDKQLVALQRKVKALRAAWNNPKDDRAPSMAEIAAADEELEAWRALGVKRDEQIAMNKQIAIDNRDKQELIKPDLVAFLDRVLNCFTVE